MKRVLTETTSPRPRKRQKTTQKQKTKKPTEIRNKRITNATPNRRPDANEVQGSPSSRASTSSRSSTSTVAAPSASKNDPHYTIPALSTINAMKRNKLPPKLPPTRSTIRNLERILRTLEALKKKGPGQTLNNAIIV